ncbi:hypothetical protein CPB83DRAFT_845428 [Crepidotus variabilis]|uniref:Uncharacterized protein n=1 Tax=Crepidotus variabilis TaxID=179855 RepID=A0A9P6ER04_9AGAR|nr:hypothetical protein CPB83DRAFT_845428 [Crepidotus variabilis]
MVELPPELVELIVDFCPYEIPLWGTPSIEDKQVLLACTTVSRSFYHVARRRLFSTFVIRNFESSSHNLQSLYELVRRPDFLALVHTLKLQIVEGRFWPLGSNDPHVQRVLSAFNQPDSTVQHLCLACPFHTTFNDNFGQLAQKELLVMVSRIHSLTIRGMASPIAFLANAPLLMNIQLLDAPLEVNNAGLGFLLSAHIKVAVFRGGVDQQLDALCQGYRDRHQDLPSFESVRLETSREYNGYNQTTLLQESHDTLYLLEIMPYARGVTPNIARFNIGGLKKLQTLRVIFDVVVTHFSLSNFLILHSLAGVSESPTAPSFVTNIEVLVLCQGTMPWPTVNNAEILDEHFPRDRFGHLNPQNLVKYHPALRSLDFIYDLSQVVFHTRQTRTIEEDESCLEQILRPTLERAILGSVRAEEQRQANISVSPYMSVRVSCVCPSPWQPYKNSQL